MTGEPRPDVVPDEAIYAFNPMPVVAAPVPPPQRRRRWLPWMGSVLLIGAVLALAAWLLLLAAGANDESMHIVWDGHPGGVATFGGMPGVLTVMAALAAVGAVLMLLPLVLAAVLVLVVGAVGGALLLALLGVAIGLGAVVLALVVPAALLLSPVILVAALVWWLARRRPRATMQA